jgi:hypothetical protein
MFNPRRLHPNKTGIAARPSHSACHTQEALLSALAQIQSQKQSVGFKQVLVATDFSDASRGALAYAIAIARRCSSALSIVHAILPAPRDPIPLGTLPRELNRRRLEAEQEMKNLAEEARIDDLNITR